MTEALFIAPLYLVVRKVHGKWKRDHINMNSFFKLNYHVQNNLKIAYSQEIRLQISNERFHKVDLEFTLYAPDKRKRDRSNVLCLHEKFCCDALVQAGVLRDDNDNVINSTKYMPTLIDKEKPRVEIKVVSCE